jgi:hypothetical protein
VVHPSWILAGLTIAAAVPAAGQSRNIILTGAPLKRIEEPFTQISGIRELPGNKAVVADRGEQKLMMVNFGTGAVTPISRKGGGPGEYQFPASVFPGPGNETWIGDPLAGKVHVVSPDGKIPTALLPPASENGIGLSMPRGVDAAARLYFQGMPRPDAGSGAMDSVSIIRWDPKAKRVDTLGKVPSGMTVNTSGSSGNSMRVMISSKPWTAAPAWGALPDGRVAVVQPAPYRVDVIGANKMVTRGPAQPYTPIKVTAAERTAYREAQKNSSGFSISRSVGGPGGGGTSISTARPPASAQEIPDSDFPATMPPFSGQNSVQVSPEGEIWVLRTRPASDKAPKYDIFNSAGQLIGKATLKPNSSVVGFGSGVVYVARQDPEDDLRYLEVYSRKLEG